MDCIEKISYINIEDKKYISINMMKDIRILDYAIEMINNNQGNGILYIDKRQLNDDISFLYDVSDYETFKDYIASPEVEGTGLISLFNNLVNVILSMPGYLLNIDNMVFDSDYIVVDKLKKTVGILYVPSDRKVQNSEEEFKQFIKEVIVDYMNKKDNMEYFMKEILPILNSSDYSLNEIAKVLSSAGSKNITTKIDSQSEPKPEPVKAPVEEPKKQGGFFSGLFKHKDNKKGKVPEYFIDFEMNDSVDSLKIKQGELVLGRLKGSCDYVVNSNVVGKVHAKVTKTKDSIVIEDLSSKNGTYVNGQKLEGNQKVRLKDGDEVRLGNVKGKVRVI